MHKFTRNRTIVGTVLILGIVAAMATHFMIQAGHVFGFKPRNFGKIAASAQGLYAPGQPKPFAKPSGRATNAKKTPDGRGPLWKVAGGLVLESIAAEIGRHAELYRDLATVPAPAPPRAPKKRSRPRPPAKLDAASPPAKPSLPAGRTKLSPLAETIIRALTTETHTLNFKQYSYKRRYSLRYLHDSGALEGGLSGYRRLVDMAYGTDLQPFVLSALFEVSPKRWTEAEIDAVKMAQQYLREHGPALVSMGRLDP